MIRADTDWSGIAVHIMTGRRCSYMAIQMNMKSGLCHQGKAELIGGLRYLQTLCILVRVTQGCSALWVNYGLLSCGRRSGLVLRSGSRGLGSSPGRVIVLCSWARHFTLTVLLSTQEYKWVPANCQENLTKCWG